MIKLFIFLVLDFGTYRMTAAQNIPTQEWLVVAQNENMTEDEKIRYLIDYLRNLSGAVFIRNGKEYSAAKAAEHLQSKWKKHKKKVKTAHDFIDRLATHSKTDEPYQIRFQDGHTIACSELLNQELAKIER